MEEILIPKAAAERLDRVAICYLENGATHTLCVPFKDEAEAREICMNGLVSMTGLPVEKIVRITKVEIVPIESFKKKEN